VAAVRASPLQPDHMIQVKGAAGVVRRVSIVSTVNQTYTHNRIRLNLSCRCWYVHYCLGCLPLGPCPVLHLLLMGTSRLPLPSSPSLARWSLTPALCWAGTSSRSQVGFPPPLQAQLSDAARQLVMLRMCTCQRKVDPPPLAHATSPLLLWPSSSGQQDCIPRPVVLGVSASLPSFSGANSLRDFMRELDGDAKVGTADPSRRMPCSFRHACCHLMGDFVE
jgi:hypothetical protein